MATAARIRKILLRHGGFWIVRRENPVHRSMARRTDGSLLVSFFPCRGMDALSVLVHLFRVTSSALLGHDLSRCLDGMRLAVAVRAGRCSQGCVDTLGNVLGLVFMAGTALHLCHLFRMRVVFDALVAIFAGQTAVCACLLLGAVHEEATAGRALEILFTVAGQTVRGRTGNRGRESHKEQGCERRGHPGPLPALHSTSP